MPAIHRQFDEPTLAAVAEQDAPKLREALQKLKDTEFVYEQSLYPVTEYLFKHPLTQEVALASQLQEKRKKLHAAVAQVIEAAHAADIDQQSALLAHHWEQAGNLAQAVRCHARAAEWTSSRDPVEGLRHWRKVRELGHSCTDEQTKESRLQACINVLSGGWRLSMSDDEMRDCIDEARMLAPQFGQHSAIALALGGVATAMAVRGQLDAAVEVAKEAFEMIDNGFDVGERLTIDVHYTYACFGAGRLPQAIDGFDRVIRLADGDPLVGRSLVNFSPSIWAQFMSAWPRAQAGRFDECWPRVQRGIRLAREHNERELLGWALGVLIQCSYLAGGTSCSSIDEMRRGAVEGLEIGETIGPYQRIVASHHYATACFLSGDFASCEERLTETLARAHADRLALDWLGGYLSIFADSCLRRRDAQAAITRAREGIGSSDANGSRFYGALSRTVLIEALIQSAAPEHEITPVIAAAHELVRKSGGNSLLPRLREAEARLAGRHDRALLIAGLREAEAMYRAMGAPDPAERLAKEIGCLGVTL